jgi:hypothetical protein
MLEFAGRDYSLSSDDMDIFPTAYFGSIGYFTELIRSSAPIIDVHEHFIKQTVRSRCAILGSNNVQHLSVPVIRSSGSKTPVNELLVNDHEKWRISHWRSIESAYANAPYFEAYDLEVRSLIFQEENLLWKMNASITSEILKLLDLEKNVLYSNKYAEEFQTDHRSTDFETAKRFNSPAYTQVFNKPGEFVKNLSILDLLFCEGPMARNWIMS